MASLVPNIAFESSHAIIDLTGFGRITNGGITVPGITYTINNLFNKNILVQIKSIGETGDYYIWTLAYHNYSDNKFISWSADGTLNVVSTDNDDHVRLGGGVS